MKKNLFLSIFIVIVFFAFGTAMYQNVSIASKYDSRTWTPLPIISSIYSTYYDCDGDGKADVSGTVMSGGVLGSQMLPQLRDFNK